MKDLCGKQPRTQENWEWTPKRRRKKMGRPIRKDHIFNDRLGNNDDSTAYSGRIEVTAYFPTGGSLQQDDDSYIMRQRGSKQFLIHQADSSEAVYTLVAKAPTELSAGEFCVKVTIRNEDSSTIQDAYVEKFYNRTVHYAFKNGGETIFGNVPYTLGAEAGEDSTVAGAGVIDVI